MSVVLVCMLSNVKFWLRSWFLVGVAYNSTKQRNQVEVKKKTLQLFRRVKAIFDNYESPVQATVDVCTYVMKVLPTPLIL